MAPRIPVYQSQVGLDDLPGVRRTTSVNARAFDPGYDGLAKAARGIGGAADDALALYAQEKHREDTTVSKDAYLRASDQLRTSMNEDIYKRKGLNTRTSMEDSEEIFNDIYETNTKEMNTKQKAQFNSLWGTLRNSTLNNVAGHRRREIAMAEDQEDQALVKAAMGDGAAVYTDPEQIKEHWGIIKGSIASLGARKGLPAEMIQNQMEAAQTTYYAGIVESALGQKDFRNAELLLKKHKPEMDDKVYAALKEKMENQFDIVTAQEQADMQLAKYLTTTEVYKADDGRKYTGESAALKEVEDTYEGAQEQRIKAEVKVRFSDARRTEAQATLEQTDKLTGEILKAKSLTEAQAVAEFATSGQAKVQLLNLAASRFPETRKKATAAQKALTDAQDIARRDSLMVRIDEGDFASEPQMLREAATLGLPKTHLDKLTDYYKQGGKAGDLTRTQLEGVMKMYGKKLEDHPELFDYTVKNLPSGKDVTDDVLRKIISPVLIEKGESTSRWWGYDADETYAAAVTKGRGDTWMPFITAKERDEIVEKLKAIKVGGKSPDITEENIALFKKHDIMGVQRTGGK